MDLTSQPTGSPKLQYQYHPGAQPHHEYSPPFRRDSRCRSTDSRLNLGGSSSAMPGKEDENRCIVSGLHSQMTESSSTTNIWPVPTQGNPPRNCISTPNILSEEYDPFAPFPPSLSSPASQDIYLARPAELAVLPASPTPSGNTSQRSSFSSAPASDIYTQASSSRTYTPRIKMEEQTEYPATTDTIMYGEGSLASTSAIPYPGIMDGNFYPEQSSTSWSKIDYSSNQDLPSISSLTIPQYDRRSESQDRASRDPQDRRRSSSAVSRTRQRKLTTKEDANYQCHVKGCGKFFGRSYNFKAHMETHDATREYPFPCPIEDCNKKFVRKTDLQRHHQSVHMKQRNHRCDYCGRYFARKDTLRRHMEDGCSKRFDIETVDFRAEGYHPSEQSSTGMLTRHPDDMSRHPSYSSSHYSPPPENMIQRANDQPFTSDSAQYLQRSDYVSDDISHAPNWT